MGEIGKKKEERGKRKLENWSARCGSVAGFGGSWGKFYLFRTGVPVFSEFVKSFLSQPQRRGWAV
jgi:hypothetical protein